MTENRTQSAGHKSALASLTDAQLADLARAKRSAIWIGLVIPLMLTVVYVAVLLAWMPQLPNPLATHWSGGGTPDGFSDKFTQVYMTAGLSVGMAVLIGSIAVFSSGKGEIAVWSGMNRFMTALSLTMSVSLGLMGVLIAHAQLGLEDARDAGGVGGVVALAFGVGIVLGVVAYVVQPRVNIANNNKSAATPLNLAPTERAVWVGTARPSTAFFAAVGIVIIAMGFGAVATWAAVAAGTEGALVAFWVIVGITLLIAVLLAATAAFRVRVDAHGLEVRSVVGWPVFLVSADEVESATAASVSPLAEFGGWGIRWAPGRTGIVLRSGEGLVVTRKNGKILAVTIDSPEPAAELLMTYASAAE